jgi:uncharacterized RDD family membrane protein YckC
MRNDMFESFRVKAVSLCAFLVAFFTTSVSFAYIGPGAGISAFGSALAFLMVVILLVVGFLWYPLKKLFGKKTPEISTSEQDEIDSDEAKEL